MAKPVLVVVDDEEATRQSLTEEDRVAGRDVVAGAGQGVVSAVLRWPPVADPVPGKRGLCLCHDARYVQPPGRTFHRTCAAAASILATDPRCL